MSLEIIGAGFGRTGTHSLKSAIELLGFGTCHHMYEVRRSNKQLSYWSDIANGKTPNWAEVFDGFSAQVDWPAARYWRQLAEFYPDAKVILTTRDPEDWYESILRTILPSSIIGRTEDPDRLGRMGSEIIYKIVLQDLFSGRLADKEFSIDLFRRHQKEVIDTIPAHRLLVYEASEGWGPLCDFVGVKVPNATYPHGNTIEEFRSRKSFL